MDNEGTLIIIQTEHDERVAEFAAARVGELIEFMADYLDIREERAANEVFMQLIGHAAEDLHGPHEEPLKHSVEIYREAACLESDEDNPPLDTSITAH
jgi:uncharacterized protein YbgA (DUF1722 family)